MLYLHIYQELIKFSINIDIKNKEKVPIKCWEPKLYFVINRYLSF